MKKKLLVICSLALVIGLCSCGNSGGLFSKATPTPIPVLSPSDVLSLAEVNEYTNYEVVQDGETEEKNHTLTSVYVSNPKGKGDSVTVKIRQSNSDLPSAEVKRLFEDTRSKRSSAEDISGLGEAAYIAFPSIHVYDRGCEIIISAGSGSNDTQKELLKRIAERVVMNLEEKLPASDATVNAASENIKQE